MPSTELAETVAFLAGMEIAHIAPAASPTHSPAFMRLVESAVGCYGLDRADAELRAVRAAVRRGEAEPAMFIEASDRWIKQSQAVITAVVGDWAG